LTTNTCPAIREDDEKAILSFSAAVPESFNLPQNPDGTRPRITLRATGDNYLEVIHALDYIRENECEDLLWELLEQVVHRSGGRHGERP